MRLPPTLANAAGYAVGIVVAYLLNRTFVFRNAEAARATATAICDRRRPPVSTLNQLVLQVASRTLGSGDPQHAVAQVIAAATYTVSVFLMSRFWVFKPAPRRGRAD